MINDFYVKKLRNLLYLMKYIWIYSLKKCFIFSLCLFSFCIILYFIFELRMKNRFMNKWHMQSFLGLKTKNKKRFIFPGSNVYFALNALLTPTHRGRKLNDGCPWQRGKMYLFWQGLSTTYNCSTSDCMKNHILCVFSLSSSRMQ